MNSLRTFQYTSLLDWCDQVDSVSALMREKNSYIKNSDPYYDYFGKPDCYFGSDEDEVAKWGSEEDYASIVTTVTRRFHSRLDTVFLAALDNVVLQRVSMGRDRYHLFLHKGLAAAETYDCRWTCERLSEAIGERKEIATSTGTLVFNAYEDLPTEAEVEIPCVFMSQMWMHNYAHWLMQVLPRFWYREAHPELAGLPVVLPPFRPGSFQEQTLGPLLGDTPRLFQRANVVQYKRLYFPSFLAPGGYSRRQVEWVNRTLRRILAVDTPEERRLKIYVSRADAGARKVHNEAEVVAFLEARGFTTHLLSRLTVRQQIELFSQADTVVMPHGAGCANLFFVPERAKVVELLPESSRPPYYWMISKFKGARYGRMVCPEVPGGWESLQVDTHRLAQQLEALDQMDAA